MKGDRLLAAGYAAAAATGSMAFVVAYANAVQMTLAGEVAQLNEALTKAGQPVLAWDNRDKFLKGEDGGSTIGQGSLRIRRDLMYRTALQNPLGVRGLLGW